MLCGFTAMAIDVGLILHERRQLQNAADAAALAGAQELLDSPSTAVAMAQQYAEANGVDLSDPDYTFAATTPYQGDSGKLEVTVSRQVGFLFGRVLGLDFAHVSARAVGEVTRLATADFSYAILVTNADCSTPDALLIPGSLNTIKGSIHSNGKVEVGGSDNSFQGPFTYSCSFGNSGQNNAYTLGPEQMPPHPASDVLSHTYSSYPCSYSYSRDTDLNSRPEVWLDNNQLKPGVYCSQGDLQLSGQGITGNVTLVAMDEVKISGSNFNLTAYFDGILAFSSASHDAAIDMSGSGGSWTGLIVAPNGRTKVQGSNNLSLAGSIITDRATVSGSDFTLVSGGGLGPGSGRIRLDE